jgi:hypothetical protein
MILSQLNLKKEFRMKKRSLWFVSLGFLICVVSVFAASTVISSKTNEKTLKTVAPEAAQQSISVSITPEAVSAGVFLGTDEASVSRIIAEKQEIQSLIDDLQAAKNAGQMFNSDLYSRLRELLPPSHNRTRGSLDQGGEDCASATVIPSVPYTDSGTTTGYFGDYSPACADGGDSPDVVYVFNPTISGYYHAHMCGSLYDTKLFIYANTCSGTPIECNDDDRAYCGDADGTSNIPSVELFAGTDYYFVMDGYGDGSAGDYSFLLEELAPPPTGDACGDPIVITSLPYDVENETNCGFTNDYNSSCLSSSGDGPDVVYEFTLTTATSVEVILNPHPTAPPSELWVMPGVLLSDHCPPDASCIAAASTWTIDGVTPLYLSCTALQPGTYYVVVDNGTWFHPCYEYDLTIQECGPCDITSEAGDIAEVAEPFPVPAGFALNDPDGGCNNTTPQFQDILDGQTVFGRTFSYVDDITSTLISDTDWYRFVLTASATLTCTYSGESWLRTALVQGPCPGTVMLNGIQSTPCDLRTITSDCLDPGEYYVKISRGGDLIDDAITYDYRASFVLTPCVQPPGRCCYDGLCADLTHYECAALDGYWDGSLTCETPCPIYPPNDHCYNAGVPATLPATFTGNNTNATNDCPQAFDPQVWHVFINPEMQDIQIDYCGTVGFSSYNQYLYDGCSCTGQTEISAVDWGMCSPTVFTGLWRNLPAGTWYYPVSWYVPNSNGPYTLHVNAVSSDPPLNDECATATPITLVPNGEVILTGTTMNATASCTNTCHENDLDYNSTGGDVFYSLTLTECRRIAMSVGFGWMHISLYQGLENCCMDPAFLCNGQDSYFQPLPDWDVPEQHLGGMNSYVAATLEPGVYLIRIGHYATMVGAYTLTVYDNGAECVPPVAADVTIGLDDNNINLRWTHDTACATAATYNIWANTAYLPFTDPSWTLVASDITPVTEQDHLYYSVPMTDDNFMFYYVTGYCSQP